MSVYAETLVMFVGKGPAALADGDPKARETAATQKAGFRHVFV